MCKSYLLVLSLLAFFGVWMGCSSDSSPVSPSNKAVTDDGTATSTGTFTVSPEAVFYDNALKYEVALKLLGADAPPAANIGTFQIFQAQMDSLRVLKAVGKGITDLRGLEHAENLDTLILGSNSITNVDSLAGLTGLVWLDLSRNGITDATPLAGLRDLVSLDLYRNSFGDGSSVSSLYRLRKLKRFGIGDGQFGSDIVNPLLANMPDLEWLKVNGTNLTNLNFLVGLTKLKWLNISANGGIEDLKPLTCLPSLETLIVRRMDALIFRTSAAGAQVFTRHIHYLSENGVTVEYAYPG